MAGVCFFFEPEHVDVFSGRDISLDAWNYAVKAAGDISEAVIIDRVGTARAFDADLPTLILGDITEWTPTGSTILIDTPWHTDNPVSLWDFNHQVDWYVFGPAAGWTNRTDGSLVIPQAGTGALHACHVASIVMLHRFAVIGGG